MQNKIVQYVRNRKGRKVGVLVGIKTEGDAAYGNGQSQVRISHSLTNIRKNDVFDAQKGIKMASGRAMGTSLIDVPQTVHRYLPSFVTRCERYFKTDNIVHGKAQVPKKQETVPAQV